MSVLNLIPGVSTLKLAGVGIAAVAIGGAAAMAWAVFSYGPDQYAAGGREKAAELDAATLNAAKDLANAAEANRLARRVCLDTGGVFDFSAGQCQR